GRAPLSEWEPPCDEEDATDRPGDHDGCGGEQPVLDGALERNTDDRGGDERDDQGAEQLSSLRVASHGPPADPVDPPAVEAYHRRDRADLDGDDIGGERGAVGTVAEAQQPPGDEKVTGRTDRQELGETLDRAEHHRLPRR